MKLDSLDLTTLMALKDFYGKHKTEPGVEGFYPDYNEDFKVDGYEAYDRYELVCAAIAKKCLELDEKIFGTSVVISNKLGK